MTTLTKGYRAITVLYTISADRVFGVAAVAAALAVAAWIMAG